MRELVKQLLDQELSRRDFGKAMAALGFSTAAAQSVLQSVATAADPESMAAYEFTGNGGEIVAECLRAADIEYVFDTNSTGQTGCSNGR
jgi:hypothetical protein